MERRYKKDYKICMVISNFYPVVGGAERQAQLLSRKLIENKTGVFVLTRRQTHSPSFEYVADIPVYRLRCLPKTTRLSSLIFNIYLFLYLIKFRNRYDIIHCHLLSTSVVVTILAAKLLSKRVIVKLGGGGLSGDIWTLNNIAFQGKRKLRYIAENVGLFVVPSMEIKQELCKAGVKEQKIKIIPNGVDLHKYFALSARDKEDLRQKMGFSHKTIKKNIIIYAGRMSPEKNVDILLKAFMKLSIKSANYVLILVGDGPLKGKYLKFIKESRLTNRVIFTGFVEDVKPYLQISDVFVLPSLYEGLPNALLEAIACGLIVVSSCAGGVKDLIKDKENGFLFESNNETELLKKLDTAFSLSSDKKEAILKRAKQTVEEKYNIDLVISQYLKTYEILNKKK